MELGFVSAILPDLGLEEVFRFAGEQGFDTVELMCWPSGGAERRYAGVTHIDVAGLTDRRAQDVLTLAKRHKVSISALGYYPNPLCADEREAEVYIRHIKHVIAAAGKLGLKRMNTFVGRDHAKSLEDNWTLFEERWPDIVKYAERCDVKIGIENCPMLFSMDEWPGGKNMAVSPRIWAQMFERIPSDHFGLNYDPSHMVWQFMDPIQPVRDFKDKLFHIHAKDLRILRDRLNACGILDFGWNEPKIPGLGEVDWSGFFAALSDVSYRGAVCIEVEDRAYEDTLEDRKRSLIQSKRYLENFVSSSSCMPPPPCPAR